MLRKQPALNPWMLTLVALFVLRFAMHSPVHINLKADLFYLAVIHALLSLVRMQILSEVAALFHVADVVGDMVLPRSLKKTNNHLKLLRETFVFERRVVFVK